MEVATSWAGLRLMKPFSTRWFSAEYSGVTLTFENGALGTIESSRKSVYGYDQRVKVFGSEWMIAISKLWD